MANLGKSVKGKSHNVKKAPPKDIKPPKARGMVVPDVAKSLARLQRRLLKVCQVLHAHAQHCVYTACDLHSRIVVTLFALLFVCRVLCGRACQCVRWILVCLSLCL
jgi:hypothetical protein